MLQWDWYRLNHGWSYDALGGAFLCNRKTAQASKRRIQLFLVMRDPLHSLREPYQCPSIKVIIGLIYLRFYFQLDDLLVQNRVEQSPGPARIVSAVHTADGLPVCSLHLILLFYYSCFIVISSILSLLHEHYIYNNITIGDSYNR